MKKKDYSNIGDDIKSIIQNALNSPECHQLNTNIKESVNRALAEVKKSSQQWKEEVHNETKKQEKAFEEKWDNAEKNKSKIIKEQNKEANRQTIRYPNKKQEKLLVTRSPKGRVSGILFMVFGNIGIGLTVLLLLTLLFIANFAYGNLPFLSVSLAVLLAILLLFVLMVVKGIKQRSRVKRFYRYVKRLNNQLLCPIKELADPIEKSPKYVVKDLRKMIQACMFTEGHIDDKETYLFISDEVYDAHLKSEESKRLNEEIAKDHREIALRKKMMEEQNPGMKAVRDVIAEGKETIAKIREANDAIPGEGFSRKLERLEQVISKIFEYIKENPDEVPEIRKFMGYYLPTTLKLVKVYKNMDGESIQGANIMATKKEIEETLNTINDAFENLLDSFYEGTAVDISTDISVLHTMLAQEGLTKRDFKKKGE
ncbi:MAG: 5-bromo-4-chloroindolyl phosphate hydrolysis family protein [Acetobacterium sp.]